MVLPVVTWLLVVTGKLSSKYHAALGAREPTDRKVLDSSDMRCCGCSPMMEAGRDRPGHGDSLGHLPLRLPRDWPPLERGSLITWNDTILFFKKEKRRPHNVAWKLDTDGGDDPGKQGEKGCNGHARHVCPHVPRPPRPPLLAPPGCLHSQMTQLGPRLSWPPGQVGAHPGYLGLSSFATTL